MSSSTPCFPRQQRAFTLIELMITVAIVAILGAIAYPSYVQYLQRGKRAAAESEMMDIANREQQFLLANRAYVDKTALEASGFALSAAVGANYSYDITVGTATVPSFSIKFTAIAGQTSDGDLTLDNLGVKAPSGKW